ncbi:transposase [bacterium]|nr:transposase [bacterium]
MARRARNDKKGYFYHLICRGQRKNPLFFSPVDRIVYFMFINEILREHDIEIFAYCLMKNHIHLLVRRNNHPIHNFMKRLNTKYALYFNKKYGLVGHVFQGRYKLIIVLDESYLFHLVKYIHLNPVNASICDVPGEYKYSSAAFYEGNKEKHILNIKGLSEIGSKSHYLKLMNSEIGEYSTYKDAIGNEADYLSFEKRYPGREKGRFVQRRNLEEKQITITKDLDKYLKKRKIKFDRIIKHKKAPELMKVKVSAIKYLLNRGYTRAEIARLFGMTKSWVTKLLARYYEKRI